jgi:hypothetical protein
MLFLIDTTNVLLFYIVVYIIERVKIPLSAFSKVLLWLPAFLRDTSVFCAASVSGGNKARGLK